MDRATSGGPGRRVIPKDARHRRTLSIGKGTQGTIIVSDLVRGRPIWFGGSDRSEQSMDLFFQ